MLDEREALVVEVRPWDVHGSRFVDVTLAYPDRRLETARLGGESVPTGLLAGDRVVVKLVMATIVEVRRAS